MKAYFKSERRRRCECGCGLFVPEGKRFVSGHNLMGIKRTKKHREAIGLAQKKSWESSKRKRIKPVPVGKICKFCGMIFFVQASSRSIKFCSATCMKKAASRRMSGDGNTFFGKKHNEATKAKLSAIHTGSSHTATAKKKMSEKGMGRKFTKKHRLNISKSLTRKKINYRSLKRAEKARIRSGYVYRLWRDSVFERDGFTCQCCGKVGGYLEAHHIKSFHYHPEIRFWLPNGITLCRKCHKAETKKQMAGNKNGSKPQ